MKSTALLPPAALLAVLLLAGAPRLARASLPTEVLELNDDNFEHDTQAASGQTTGVWAVLFNEHHMVRKAVRASAVVRELAKDEDKEVIYAEVDLSSHSNYHTAKRFGAAIDPPALVLFRDGKMYTYDRSFEGADILDRLKEFVGGGYEATTPLDVPGAERNVLDKEGYEKSTSFDWGNASWAWILIITGIAIHAWAIMQMGGIGAARAAAEDWLAGKKADSDKTGPKKPEAGPGPAGGSSAEGAPAAGAAAAPRVRRKDA